MRASFDPPKRVTTVTSWIHLLERDRLLLEQEVVAPAALAAAAPRLVETIDRGKLADALGRLTSDEIAAHSGLAFAEGYLALQEGAVDEAVEWLTRAQSALRRDETRLAARIAFELGALYLARNCKAPADVLLLDSERRATGQLADLLHLRALVAESMGDHVRAITLYREALGSQADSLSPSTRVLVMINLAASCHQRDPAEALALTELAIAVIAAHQLHPQLRPPALNIMGYALICLGRLREARETLARAASEAQSHDHRRVELYAAFNEAIVDELEGDVDAAKRRLRDVGQAAEVRFPELAGWARIRLIWLSWLLGDVAGAGRMLTSYRTSLRSMRYAESISCIEALLEASTGRPSHAIARLESACRAASLRGDSTTEFALLLRLAHIERSANGTQRGARRAARALALLETCTFRLSPNWWSAEIVSSFAELVAHPLASGLVAPAREHRPDPDEKYAVLLRMDGTAAVGTHEISLQWRAGRTGSRVLVRLFRQLLENHPRALDRDELADRLWPESDGDAAVRNLYAAANDLRKVLIDLPGVVLQVTDGGYALRLAENVTVVSARPALA